MSGILFVPTPRVFEALDSLFSARSSFRALISNLILFLLHGFGLTPHTYCTPLHTLRQLLLSIGKNRKTDINPLSTDCYPLTAPFSFNVAFFPTRNLEYSTSLENPAAVRNLI